jgi:FAD synthase
MSDAGEAKAEATKVTTTTTTPSIPTMMGTPLLLASTVAKGFGRGAKLLGCPTANMPLEQLGVVADTLEAGIYCGWAQILDGEGGTPKSPTPGKVHKAVTSIGWNPYFDNKEKTVEPHIMHTFDEDFYGCRLKLLVVARLRDEKNFDSMEALIEAIQQDIRDTDECLNGEEFKLLAAHDHFKL